MLLIILFVIIRILSNSFSNVFQKKLSLNYSSSFINSVAYFFLCIICLVFFSKINLQILYCSFFMGLFGAIGNAFQIKALRCGELSVLTLINSYKVIFSLVVAFIFLKEFPSKPALLGMILIFLGSYFIFETTKEGFSLLLFKRKDILFRIFAVFFTSLEAICIKKNILMSNPYNALFLWAFSSFLFSLLFCSFNKKTKIQKRDCPFFISLILTMGLMQYSTNILFNKIPVSSALSLFSLSSLLNIFLGYKFFSEKSLIRKIIAGTIMLFGVVLIANN